MYGYTIQKVKILLDKIVICDCMFSNVFYYTWNKLQLADKQRGQ